MKFSISGSFQERTTFSWRSRAFLWAYFIYFCETLIVTYVAQARFKKFLSSSDRRFDEIIYNIIFLSILAPHYLLPLASWRNGSEVAKFKNMWTNFQVRYLNVTGSPIEFPILMPITWSLCFFSWGSSIAIVLSQFYLQPDFPLSHTFAYYHILAMLNGFCSLWYINCTAFGLASKALQVKFSCFLFNFPGLKYPLISPQNHVKSTLNADKPSKILAKYRNLWVDLSHMMQQLGKAYSNMYGIYCLVIFFTTIIASYGSLSEIIDHGVTLKDLGLFIIVIYCMTLLFIICNEAHHASRRVGLGFQDILLNINLTTVDVATQKEIEMFLVAIDKNPPTMNLDGYANINRELITSNLSFMATYLVVLMQFKLTLLRSQSAKKIFSEDEN